MKTKLAVVFGICVLALVLASAAIAAEKDAPDVFVYGTYSKCALNRQARADELVKTVYAPIMDADVASKKIQAWGLLAHNTGGEWRRVMYFVAPSLDQLYEAGAAMQKEVAKEHALALNELGDICYAHDDYVWHLVTGSKPASEVATKRASAGFSVYFICDSSREQRADEIVKTVMGPLWDAQVKAGKINSWNWFEHYIGGVYRRLAVMDGPDFESLFAARAAVIGKLQESHKDLATEFDSICGSHQDYLWDIEIARP